MNELLMHYYKLYYTIYRVNAKIMFFFLLDFDIDFTYIFTNFKTFLCSPFLFLANADKTINFRKKNQNSVFFKNYFKYLYFEFTVSYTRWVYIIILILITLLQQFRAFGSGIEEDLHNMISENKAIQNTSWKHQSKCHDGTY